MGILTTGLFLSMKTSIIVVSFLLIGVSSRSVVIPPFEKYSNGDDCMCITKTEEVIGGKITGEYTYEDPVGSTIVVSYSMNLDKTNYVEERKVYKKYVNSGQADVPTQGGLTAEQVVERVLTQITPTTLQVIRSSVQGSTLDLSSSRVQAQLVDTIITKLRPVVFRIVEEALQETYTTYLDAGDLTELIISELIPIVEEGVQQESENVLASQNGEEKRRFELRVVQEVSQSLRPTIIRIIQATIAQSSVDLSNFEALFRTIIKALRPVVYQEVQKALSASYNSYNVDANELSELIMTELTPFVREALTQEVQNAQANTLSEDQVVQLIITELRPTVIRIIKATVQSENIDLSNLDQLLQTILVQLRPVVYNEVTRALASSNVNLNADSLTDRILREMTTFINDALQQEVRAAMSQLEDQVVTQVIRDLKSTVIRIVQATVSSSGVDLSDVNGLLETILTQLRPVVLKEVNSALSRSSYSLNANALANRIVTELRPFVLQALRAEVEKYQQVQANQVQKEVVNRLDTDLKYTVDQTIKETVANAGNDLENTGTLVEIFIRQLRPVIFKAVQNALASAGATSIDPEQIVIKIIIEITPSIESGVQDEVTNVKQQNEELMEEILRVMPPRLTGVIRDRCQEFSSSELQSLPESVLVERVVAAMQSDIIGAIRSDSKYRVVINQQGFGDLMQRLIAILRPVIIKELQIIKSSLRAPVPPPPQPKPSGGSDLLSIFGVNGKNTVNVKTPTHNYGYEVDGELSSSYQDRASSRSAATY